MTLQDIIAKVQGAFQSKPLSPLASYNPSPTPTPTVDPFVQKGWVPNGDNSYAWPTATPTPQSAPAVLGQTSQSYPGLQQRAPEGDISEEILKVAAVTGIHPSLLAAILWTESGYRPDAVNSNSDYGIAQINLASHPDVTMEQAYDPKFAIPWMGNLVGSHIKNFGDINRGVAAYNVGPGGASIQGPNRFGAGPKAQEYVNKVAKNLTPELIQELGLLPNY